MEKAAYIDALKALTTQENPLAVSREVADLRAQFEDLLLKETHAFQVKQAEARENGEEPEEFVSDGIREEFYEVYSEYRDRRNAAQKTQKDQEDQNLRRKKHLIERLREVIQNEENIGSALAKYKDIHEEWKAVGDIPREKRQEIQSEYSRMLEDFFYHLRIYRELREHDLHRNQQLKLDVIDRIQKLSEVGNIKDVETAIRNLQHEWDEIGPVNNAEWENLKATYWDNVRAVYARIQEFYDGRRNELVTNLEQKKEIVSKAKAMFDLGGFNTASEWEKNTDSLLKLQEEWKNSPAGPRKENEDLWKEFRGYCDQFFSAKKEHYEKLRGDYDAVADQKRALISEVESLKDSTDWKDTSDKIIKIQQRWKQLGNAGQRNEQKLWKEFRAACDLFFNRKQAHFAEQDKALEANLSAKQALIDKINAYTLPEDKHEAIEVLKGFSAEFSAIGFVPAKQKDAIYNAYREALDKHYQQLKLEGAEQDRVMFQARLDTLKASPNADKALARERGEIMDRMNKLKAEVLQYENNLGFFGRSKGADAMRKEIEKKIENSKTRIAELQSKLKQLRNE